MTFSAGRQRRVASPFAQRAAEHAKAQDTPDISTIPDPNESESEPQVDNTPEILEERPEPSVESTNQESSNEDEGGVQEPTSEAVANDQPKQGRGRPKSAEVKERDERIYNALTAGPKTRAELEEELELTGNDAYMSLFRLRTAGRVERRRESGAHKWYPVEADSNAE